MKKLTPEQLLELVWGNVVWKFDGYNMRKLYFVGKDPRSERSLIFCDGSHIERVYVDKDTSRFTGKIYEGPWDSKFHGELMIQYHQEQIKVVKEIYIDGK